MRREEIPEDDLPEMEKLFRIFSSAKSSVTDILEKQSSRCKIKNIELFENETHWVIDRWWTRSERIAIGADESVIAAGKSEVDVLVKDFSVALSDYEKFISDDPLDEALSKEITLGNKKLFRLFLGKRVLKSEVNSVGSTVPVYSANVFEPMGLIGHSNITDFKHPSVLWGIDGNFEFNLISTETIFATTDHCGTIQILDKAIVPEYLLSALHHRRIEESFDRSFRASLANMRLFKLAIPVKPDGAFDVQAQKAIAKQFTAVMKKRAKLELAKTKLDETFRRYFG